MYCGKVLTISSGGNATFTSLNDESYTDKWLIKIESTADQVEFADLLDYSDYREEVQ